MKIQRNPEVSYTILCTANADASLAKYAHAHHERWDGLGYPKELKGEKNLLPAPIIIIANTYDAMINNRPYGKKNELSRSIERNRDLCWQSV